MKVKLYSLCIIYIILVNRDCGTELGEYKVGGGKANPILIFLHTKPAALFYNYSQTLLSTFIHLQDQNLCGWTIKHAYSSTEVSGVQPGHK